jgi:hypothetical protein
VTQQQWEDLKPGDVVEFFVSKRRMTIAGGLNKQYGYPAVDDTGRTGLFVASPRQVDLVEAKER